MLTILIIILAACTVFLAFILRQDWKIRKMLKERDRQLEESKRRLLEELDRFEEKHRRDKDGTI